MASILAFLLDHYTPIPDWLGLNEGEDEKSVVLSFRRSGPGTDEYGNELSVSDLLCVPLSPMVFDPSPKVRHHLIVPLKPRLRI